MNKYVFFPFSGSCLYALGASMRSNNNVKYISSFIKHLQFEYLKSRIQIKLHRVPLIEAKYRHPGLRRILTY